MTAWLELSLIVRLTENVPVALGVPPIEMVDPFRAYL